MDSKNKLFVLNIIIIKKNNKVHDNSQYMDIIIIYKKGLHIFVFAFFYNWKNT